MKPNSYFFNKKFKLDQYNYTSYLESFNKSKLTIYTNYFKDSDTKEKNA